VAVILPTTDCGICMLYIKTEDRVMNKTKSVIGLMIMMCLMISCGQKQTQTTAASDSDSRESSSGQWEVTVTDSVEQETKKPVSSFTVNKTVFENEYAVITLNTIRTDGIEMTAESKLKNRVQGVSINSLSLDGLCVDAYSYRDDSLQPGEKKDLFLEGEIKNPEHHTISIAGGLYDDTGSEFADIDIVDFELGGNQTEEYSVNTSFSEYKSEHLDVDYVGIDSDGIKVAVKNKNAYKLNLVCDTLAINGEDTDDYYWSITIPGHSTRIYVIDVFNGKPDFIPEEIHSFVGNCYTWGADGIREEEFTIASDETLLPETTSSVPLNNDISNQNEQDSSRLCEVDGCDNVGIHGMVGFSGETEWYCENHYQEMRDILDKIEKDTQKDQGAFINVPSTTVSYDATLKYRSGAVVVFSSKDSMDRFTNALSKEYQGSIDEMISNGEVAYVEEDTKCNILEEHLTYTKVKIVDGAYAGNTFIVASEAVHKQ